MKHKYYYNNQLVRTSENEYKYGVLKGSKIVACTSRLDLAQKRLNEELNNYSKLTRSNEKYLETLKEEDTLYEVLKQTLERQKRVLNNIKIVELEQR